MTNGFATCVRLVYFMSQYARLPTFTGGHWTNFSAWLDLAYDWSNNCCLTTPPELPTSFKLFIHAHRSLIHNYELSSISILTENELSFSPKKFPTHFASHSPLPSTPITITQHPLEWNTLCNIKNLLGMPPLVFEDRQKATFCFGHTSHKQLWVHF